MTTLSTAANLAATFLGTGPTRGWLARARASGLSDAEWVPDAARSWIESPPDDAPLVAWFTGGDADWGDVVVWKAAAGRRPPAGQGVVQAYQEWPARMGYWRTVAGDDRIAQLLYATFTAWNAAMRQFVKIERVPPAAALERMRDLDPDIFDFARTLLPDLPGAAQRLPLLRGGRQTEPAGGSQNGANGNGVPAAASRHARVRELVIEYGPAITGFCRRWGKDSGRPA